MSCFRITRNGNRMQIQTKQIHSYGWLNITDDTKSLNWVLSIEFWVFQSLNNSSLLILNSLQVLNSLTLNTHWIRFFCSHPSKQCENSVVLRRVYRLVIMLSNAESNPISDTSLLTLHSLLQGIYAGFGNEI